MINEVTITKQALKKLNSAPKHIREKLRAWMAAVQKAGLLETRKIRGWRDESLLGNRATQRSIRLNKQWRAIYILKENGTIKFIRILEVIPHDY